METMTLKFLDGERKTIRDQREKPPKDYEFNPVGEVPKGVGERILAAQKQVGRFEVVGASPPPEAEFRCDVCGEVAKSKAGLGSHKRKHK